MTRVAANIVDLVVVIVILGAIYGAIAGITFLVHPSSFRWPSSLGWSIPVVGFVIVIPYLTLSWCATGRTYGDALLGLRVVNYRGGRLRIPGATLRAAACTDLSYRSALGRGQPGESFAAGRVTAHVSYLRLDATNHGRGIRRGRARGIRRREE